MRLRGMFWLTALVLVSPVGLAEAAPDTPEQAADKALAAFQARDTGALKVLAAKDDPDPWLVVDGLLARGERSASEAFAEAAKRPDTERLPVYVLEQGEKPTDPARREALATATARGADPEEELASLDRAATGADVTGVRAHLARGEKLRARRMYAESAAAFRAAAETAGRIGWVEGRTRGLYECGSSLLARSDFRGALAAWKERLAIEEQRTKRTAIASTLYQVGVAHFRLGELEESRVCMERSLAMAEELGDRMGIALALGGLGNVHSRHKDHRQALALRQRALEISREIGDRRTEAAALGNLGNTWFDLGDYAQALSCQERCLALMEESGDETGVARTLNSLGNLYGRLGDYPKAVSVLTRSLRLHEREGNRAGVARALLNLGSIYENTRDHSRAVECFSSALAIAEEVGDRVAVAMLLKNLGQVHLAAQDIRKAFLCMERATGLHEALGDRAGMASLLADLGTAHWYLGDCTRARDLLWRAHSLFTELGDRNGAARAIASLGNLCAATCDHAGALSCFEQALAIFRESGDRGSELITMVNLGIACEGLGKQEQAIEQFRGVIEACAHADHPAALASAHALLGRHFRRTGSEAAAAEHLALAREAAERSGDRRRLLMVLWEVGLLRQARGQHREAAEAAREAVSELQVFLRGLAEDQEPTAREVFSGVFALGVGAARSLGEADLCAFFLESERAGALVEGLRLRDSLWSAVIPEELRRQESEARAAESVASCRLRWALASGRIEDVRSAQEGYRSARVAVLDAIARIQREVKAAASLVYPAADPLPEIRTRLAEGDVLLLYGLLPGASVALVVTRDDARIVPLGGVDKIKAACDALHLDQPDRDPSGPLRDLARLVYDPLGLDDGVKRVLVCADGALSWIPFALLAGDRDVCSIPSATVHGLLLGERERRGEGVLALGDPDYEGAAGSQAVALARGSERLQRLPGTAAEARKVGTTVLLGPQATEAGLREALSTVPRWRAVHLACHGLLDPERPMFSSLALTPSGEDDGLLTVMDVFRLKIPADLAVLSACETGRGQLFNAEGVVGFARAFLFAGTPRVLVSLWKVDDAATSALMEKFHELWNPKEGKGLPAATALKQAQEFIKSQERWKHPSYWAAWVLWGLPD